MAPPSPVGAELQDNAFPFGPGDFERRRDLFLTVRLGVVQPGPLLRGRRFRRDREIRPPEGEQERENWSITDQVEAGSHG